MKFFRESIREKELAVIGELEKTTSIEIAGMPLVSELYLLDHPLLQVSGLFAIDEPGWADRHDEYLAEMYEEDNANEK